MKILLTSGFIPGRKSRSPIVRGFFPPLGLGYIAAVLEKEGYKVEIYHCLALNCSANEIVDYILHREPDIIGISVMSPNYEGAREMLNLIKKKRNIPIIFGGPHCSLFPVRTMEECQALDFLIYGEGEFIFPMLIEAIMGKIPYNNIPQLCFRETNGRITLNKQELLNQDLDIIPIPAWHLFNRDLYSHNVGSCITSRGCSYGKCAFCFRTEFLYDKYRRRSVENVIKELEFLCKKFSLKKIVFLDDNFAQDEEWVIRFCEMLKQRKLKLKWFCNARVDTITRKMIKNMAEAGCFWIGYGLESGSQDLLDYINKGILIEQIKEVIKLSKVFGIKVYGYFMLALPKETPEIGRRTVQFAIDLDLDLVQFAPVRPLFGTKLYDLCKNEGEILNSSYEFYDTSNLGPYLIPKINFVPKDYKDKRAVSKMIRFAYRRFYLRYSCIWKLLLDSIEDRDPSIRFVDQLRLFKNLIFYKST